MKIVLYIYIVSRNTAVSRNIEITRRATCALSYRKRPDALFGPYLGVHSLTTIVDISSLDIQAHTGLRFIKVYAQAQQTLKPRNGSHTFRPHKRAHQTRRRD